MHFTLHYRRQVPGSRLLPYIDYFWETRFSDLFKIYPAGFSDALFPNLGYTYLLNLGTPFVLQLGEEKFLMKSDGFLPRHKHMICYHQPGNHIFGIKFRVSPVLFEKRINFSEYRNFIFPLAYLIEKDLATALKRTCTFEERVSLAAAHYQAVLDKHQQARPQVQLVSDILSQFGKELDYRTTIDTLASDAGISTRTLQRYFEATTGIPGKQALQLLRIRRAVESWQQQPGAFSFCTFGYYDRSHFYKHLRSFLTHTAIRAEPLHTLIKRSTKTV